LLQKTNYIKWGSVILLVAIVLALTHDIIITNILAFKICKSDPSPKVFINKTVESPGSIYWEDNIFPGFDNDDRLLMIRNYLDGVNLKTMALNAPDGTIHLFTSTKEDWQESKEIKARNKTGNYLETLEKESKTIAARGKVYTRETMPQLNYSVVFNPVPLTDFEQRYLYSDEAIITENKSKNVIAYNRRLMRRWYFIMPDIGMGNRYYHPDAMCGGGSLYGFDNRVFPIQTFNGTNHLWLTNNKIFNINKAKSPK